MAIIKPKVSIQLTEAQKKAQTKMLLDSGINTPLDGLKARFQDNYDLVWNNKFGLSAQQVFDLYGTDASQLFLIANAIGTAIYTLDNTWIPLEAKLPYVINQDGSVTVTEAVQE